jgi:hypothetical protein
VISKSNNKKVDLKECKSESKKIAAQDATSVP